MKSVQRIFENIALCLIFSLLFWLIMGIIRFFEFQGVGIQDYLIGFNFDLIFSLIYLNRWEFYRLVELFFIVKQEQLFHIKLFMSCISLTKNDSKDWNDKFKKQILYTNIVDILQSYIQLMKIKQILVWIWLILSCTSLHLQHSEKFDYSLRISDYYSDFFVDNLDQPTLNYYYGNLNPETYLKWAYLQDFNSSVRMCPKATPYANYSKTQNKQQRFENCFACEPLTSLTSKALFNRETRQCEVCTIDKTAVCNDFLKKIAGSSNKTEQSNAVSVENSKLFELCPPERPLYNPDTKLCDDCPPLQQFDGPAQSCLPIIFTTNLQAKNVLMPKANSLEQQKYQIQKANPTRLVQECPIGKPYLLDKACTTCQSNFIFNLTSQTCVQCGQGTFYNPNSFNCEASIFYPDVTASNIVSQTQTFQAWRSKVQFSTEQSPRMTKCAKQKPFVVNGQCVSCNGDTPLFDIDREECSACSKGRSYNSEKRLCVGSYDSGSSLKRMVANIA